MATLIIAEKASQARDVHAALGAQFGQILAAEGHLLRLAEPEEVNSAWKSWSCVVLKPDGLFPTRPSKEGNKPAKLKAIAAALRCCDDVILATDCDREGQLIGVGRKSSLMSVIAAMCGGLCSRRRIQRRCSNPLPGSNQTPSCVRSMRRR